MIQGHDHKNQEPSGQVLAKIWALEAWLSNTNRQVQVSTRNLSGDEVPKRDIALFCYPFCV